VGGFAEQARTESAALPRPRWLIYDWVYVDLRIASAEIGSSSPSPRLVKGDVNRQVLQVETSTYG